MSSESKSYFHKIKYLDVRIGFDIEKEIISVDVFKDLKPPHLEIFVGVFDIYI